MLAVSSGSTVDIGDGTTGSVNAATLAVASSLVNDGTVDVGPGGLIDLGGAATLTNEADGLLAFGIDGRPEVASDYGRISNGTLSLGGSAGLVAADGFAPSPGAEYFVDRGSSTGAFATVLHGGSADYSDPGRVGLIAGTPGGVSATAAPAGTSTSGSASPTPMEGTTAVPSGPVPAMPTVAMAPGTQIPTTTSLTSSTRTSTYGQEVSFTATVTAGSGSTSPTGTVTFSDEWANPLGTVPLSSAGDVATATFASSSLTAGSHWVTATYNGDPNWSASSTPAPLRLGVAEAMTAVTLASSVSTAAGGPEVTLTATIASAATGETGTVQFDDNGSFLGAAPVSGGHATFQTSSLNPGSITAVYEGDDDFVGTSSTNTVGQAVLAAPGGPVPTTTSLTSSSDTSTYGRGVSFTATVTPADASISPTGTVTFYDSTTPLGSAPLSTMGGVATATLANARLAAGDHWIIATYDGDPNASVSSSGAPVRLRVAEAMTSLTVASSATVAVLGQDVTLTATIESAAPGETGTVQFAEDGSVVGWAPVSGGHATVQSSSLTPGAITAVYEGDADFVGTSSTNTVDETVYMSALDGAAAS